MALNFPDSPTTGQIFTAPNGTQWQWNGTTWTATGTSGGPFLALAGGTMNGAITQPAAPVAGTDLANKAYVDAGIAADAAISANNTGRNFIHNGTFTVAQRGVGPFTATGYTADRWRYELNIDTASITLATLADADRSAIGDETAQTAWQNVYAGSATAGSYSLLGQRIERVRRLGNKAVTFSFWARAASGAPRVCVAIYQSFGTGGSPSASIRTSLGLTAALSATWTRYVMSGTFPSTAGKTLGTNGDDYAQAEIWLSDTANYTSSGLGTQSGTVQIYGIQLEIGSGAGYPTPLARRDPADELALCQRFYETNTVSLVGYSVAGGAVGQTLPFAVAKRAAPTMGSIGGSFTNGSALTTDNLTPLSFRAWFIATAAGGAGLNNWTYTASADL